MHIAPFWPAPRQIKAFHTLRTGGTSPAPYDSFNLGFHTGDAATHVAANRLLLKTELNLPNEPIWINQVHGITAIPALPENREATADASFSNKINQICTVLTADCLPIFICHRLGTHVAAIHAGWRGLAHGIIEETLKALAQPPHDLLVWLGPAIGPGRFEVGEDVYQAFVNQDAKASEAFIPNKANHWLANLYQLAKLRLQKQGIHAVYGGDFCTYDAKDQFYSYRRDQGKTGRMASLIWISNN